MLTVTFCVLLYLKTNILYHILLRVANRAKSRRQGLRSRSIVVSKNARSEMHEIQLRSFWLSLPLRGFAMLQRRFNPLNGRLGLPSAGFDGMATNPSRQGRLPVVAAGRQGFASFGYGYIGGSLARSNVSYCISDRPKLISSAYGIRVARR